MVFLLKKNLLKKRRKQLNKNQLKVTKAVNNKMSYPAFAEGASRCYKRIITLVRYRERCEQELYKRLVLKEKFKVDDFNKALAKAKKYDLVNDSRYAELYTFSKTHSFHGVYGVIKHLKDMNIEFSNNDCVLDIIEDAKINEYSQATLFLKRHPSKAKNLYSSYVNKLINRGYSFEIAQKVTKDFIFEQN